MIEKKENAVAGVDENKKIRILNIYLK